MRLKKQYAIRFEGKEKFWVNFNKIGQLTNSGWWTSVEFVPGCLLTEQQANAFVKQPGIDERYKKYEVKMDAFRIG